MVVVVAVAKAVVAAEEQEQTQEQPACRCEKQKCPNPLNLLNPDSALNPLNLNPLNLNPKAGTLPEGPGQRIGTKTSFCAW